MPIKGLTDGSRDLRGGGMPLLARLYKGSQKQDKGGKKIFGKDLPYFRVEFEPQYTHLQPAWLDLYGEQPVIFSNVVAAGNNVGEVFSTAMEEWTGGNTLLRRCDGEYVQVQWTGAAYDRRVHKGNCGSCECRRVGRLNLIFPDLFRATGTLGYIMAITHSVHDIMNLYDFLAGAERNLGTLHRARMRFGRASRTISTPGKDGKRMAIEKSLLYLEYDPQFAAAMLDSGEQQPALPAPAPQLTTTVVEPSWTEAEMVQFVHYWRENGWSDKDLLSALGVSGLREWQGSLQSANAAINEVIEMNTGGHDE